MSDMHVLAGDDNGRWVVVMHFPVANANNAVAVNYRTALIASGLGGTTVMPTGTGAGQISAAELAQVQSGELYEHIATLLAESGGTAVGVQRAMLRAEYARLQTTVMNTLQARLRYFGHTESAV